MIALGALLAGSGWTPERNVSALVQRWEASGVRLSDAARDQLSSFGGLTIDPHSQRGENFAPVRVELDPSAVDRDRLMELGPELGPLSALGTVDHGNGFLVMDAGGRVHLLFEDHRYIGAGIAEALTCLLTGKWPQDAEL